MKNIARKNLVIGALLVVSLMLPIVSFGQTKVTMPKNKQKISKDIEVGGKTAAQVNQMFPMINDQQSVAYINEVGRRLANAVPPEFQQPAFNCQFRIVNASDINAFALPACYLYVNRGMIDAAKNEGEMAGVMAHEISHAMLRHGTAQGPGALATIGAIGAIFGGAIVGAPELGQMVAAGVMTKYSRAFEKQSDLVGANMMARAGYDPRDLANMFRTIAGESEGQRAPEWVSSHPDPGNRFNYINQEAAMLRVSSNPIKITQGFLRTKQFLRSLPPAKTMEQIEKEAQGQQQGGSPTANGKYSQNVPFPSSSSRTYNNGGLSANVPSNWKEFPSQNEIWLAPDGAYGDQGITHGAIIGIQQGGGGNFQQEFDTYVKGVVQANSYLQAQSNYTNTTLNNKNGLAIQLGGRSPVTNQNELVTIYGAQTNNGSLFYVITVVPQNQANNYQSAFRNILRSLRLSER